MRTTTLAKAWIAISLTTGTASAGEITISSGAPVWDVAGTGNSDPLAASSSNPVSATAQFGIDFGTATFGPEALATLNGEDGIFLVESQTIPGETLSISFLDGDHITGSVQWIELADGSNNPNAEGYYHYTASGDPSFLTAFGTTGAANISVVFQETLQTLENWNTDTPIIGQTVTINSSLPVTVDEPSVLSVLALFGIIFLAAAPAWRNSTNQNRRSR